MSLGRSAAGVFELAIRGQGVEERRLPVGSFPFHLGRSPGLSCVLEAPGVWDRHLHLELLPGEGLVLVAAEGALVLHEGEVIRRHRVRNGDEFQAGSVRIQVMVSTPPRRSLLAWEIFLWVVLAAVAVVQVAAALQLLPQ